VFYCLSLWLRSLSLVCGFFVHVFLLYILVVRTGYYLVLCKGLRLVLAIGLVFGFLVCIIHREVRVLKSLLFVGFRRPR